MLAVCACRFPLPLGRAGPLFGLGRLAARPGGLLIGGRSLLFRRQAAGGRLLAMLGCNLATILKLAVARPLQQHGKYGDHDHGDDDDRRSGWGSSDSRRRIALGRGKSKEKLPEPVLSDLLEQLRDAVLLRLAEVGLLSF
jgi:hypothetical protein